MVKVGSIDKKSLEAFKRALKGEEKVVEHMEEEGQKDVFERIMLAKVMEPPREEWEKLGFIFNEIAGEEVLLQAVLPKGWKLKQNENNAMWTDILDEKGTLRGQMFYKAAFYQQMAHMELFKKYGIKRNNISMDPIIDEVYFGNSQEVLFIGGRATLPLNPTEEQRNLYFEQLEEATQKVREFAAENYPDWENPLAYWDQTDKPKNTLGI